MKAYIYMSLSISKPILLAARALSVEEWKLKKETGEIDKELEEQERQEREEEEERQRQREREVGVTCWSSL